MDPDSNNRGLNDRTVARSSGSTRPPIQWPQRNQSTDAERATELARRSVSRTYARDGQPNSMPQAPVTNQVFTTQNQIDQIDTQNPTSSTEESPQPQHHIMREEPYDWNTYHHAWQQYYHQYFYRYYASWWQQQRQQLSESQKQAHPESQPQTATPQPLQPSDEDSTRQLRDSIRQSISNASSKAQRSNHFKPLLSAALVATIFLAINYNQVVIGAIRQYVSPGDVVTTPVIVEPNVNVVGQDPKIIIPKIGVEAPIVFDEPRVDEVSYQAALERGVVRLGNSADPGTVGNVVIGGHSSNNVFNPGRYKYVFVNLKQLQIGDIFYIHFNGVRFTYKVTVANKIIAPHETSVLNPTPKPTVTLFTCDPPGTNVNRLIVQAEQIDPDPSEANVNENKQVESNTANPLPSVAPSFWRRLFSN